MNIVYEDNHIIVVNKQSGILVQSDKTQDLSLTDIVKDFIKKRDNKQGNVFLTPVHRIDRPVSGLTLFAKTSKALSRFSDLFAKNAITKIYLAILDSRIPGKDEAELSNYLFRNQELNKSFVCEKNKEGAKHSRLSYRYIFSSDNYFFYEISLYTGRHHQIRAQLANLNCHIKGDVKYGARRANLDKSICLHSYRMIFQHPISGKDIDISSFIQLEQNSSQGDKEIESPRLVDSSEERLWTLFKEKL